MIKRTITGICLIAVVTGFFFLREVDLAFFEAFLCFLSTLGAFEMTRAMGENIRLPHKIAAIVFGAAVAPIFHFFGTVGVCYLFMGFAVLQLLLTVFLNAEAVSFAYGVTAMVYPCLFIACMLVLNAMEQNSLLALVTVFVLPSAADTFAYVVGSIFKGKKLCPSISPNKTISGAIGGLVGGAIATVVLYFIFRSDLVYSGKVPELLLFILVGMATAFLTEVGDLAESVLKRKFGVKDMGKLLPGHGGILDRIDGVMLAGVFLTLVFTLFIR